MGGRRSGVRTGSGTGVDGSERKEGCKAAPMAMHARSVDGQDRRCGVGRLRRLNYEKCWILKNRFEHGAYNYSGTYHDGSNSK